VIPCEGFEIVRRCFAPDLFDTSPLQVHTHANILHAYVDIGKGRTYEDVHASASKLFAYAGMRLVALTA
jgi:hypothetical protein